MQIESRLTDLTDKELENLYGNAVRLAQSGTGAQKAAAEGLLPHISEEVARRIEALEAKLAGRREERRASMAKARAMRKNKSIH